MKRQELITLCARITSVPRGDENFERDHSVYYGVCHCGLREYFFAHRRIVCSTASSSQQQDRVMQEH